MVPSVLADRSIATLRNEVAAAPLALIAPLFSTSETPPLRSRIAVATPSTPVALDLIVPLLRIVATLAPWSIRIAVARVVPLLLPVADTVPETRTSGTVACAPIFSAVASAPAEVALIAPATLIPFAMLTAPPRPPMARPVALTPL